MIVGDDAGQFAVGLHALCRVRAERLVHELEAFTDLHRPAQARLRAPIRRFYADLKAYRREPSRRRRAEPRGPASAASSGAAPASSSWTGCSSACAPTSPNCRRRSTARRSRCTPAARRTTSARAQVTRRRIGGGARSDMGRDCRDAFLGLAKTCAELGLSFWDHLGARLAVPGQIAIPYLPDLVRGRRKLA